MLYFLKVIGVVENYDEDSCLFLVIYKRKILPRDLVLLIYALTHQTSKCVYNSNSSPLIGMLVSITKLANSSILYNKRYCIIVLLLFFLSFLLDRGL